MVFPYILLPKVTRPLSTPVDLSIIITSWNTRDLLQGALDSMVTHPPRVPYEIIVVDNDSDDGSGDMVERAYPMVRLLRNPRNEGFARANNQGAAMAAGRALLLLGSDVVLIDDSIQRMYDHLMAHDDIGALGCRFLSPDRTVQQSCRRFPRLRDGILTYLSLHSLAGSYNMRGFDYYQSRDVDQLAATCLMIRKPVLAQIGLFDERYAILYNDVDLCLRIRRAGWRICYLADAEIIHHGSQSTSRATPAVRLEMYRNILVYYSRTFGIPAIVTLLPILGVRLAIVNRGKCVFGLFSLKHLTS